MLSTFGSEMRKMTLCLAYEVACLMFICSVIALGADLNQYKLVEGEGEWQPATATWYGSPNGD